MKDWYTDHSKTPCEVCFNETCGDRGRRNTFWDDKNKCSNYMSEPPESTLEKYRRKVNEAFKKGQNPYLQNGCYDDDDDYDDDDEVTQEYVSPNSGGATWILETLDGHQFLYRNEHIVRKK